MRINLLKSRLLLSAALTSSLAAAPALAQDQADATAPVDEVASNPADIIVTARRVEERLQDVPISITVFTQEQITNRNIVSATDLAAYTPSLSVNTRYGTEKASFSIRGFNQELSTSPTVGVYFAEAIGPRAQGGTTSGNSVGPGAFMDLQSVQVLKGPQGTLFGRNTTGGAILLTPNRPTGRLEGWVEGQAGGYDLLRGQAVVNIPLAETFKVRVAVDRNKRDGYVRNHSGIGPDRYNDTNYFAARLSILGELTPNLENYTVFSYSNSFARGSGARLVACNSGLAANQPPQSPTAAPSAAFTRWLLSRAACDQIARQAARGDSWLDVEINNPDAYVRVKQLQIVNTTTWDLSDELRLKNIASYAEFRERSQFSLNNDNFFVPATSPIAPGQRFQQLIVDNGPFGDNAQQTTFTEELQMQGHTSDSRLNWVIGGYLEASRPIGMNSAANGVNLNCTDPATVTCTNPVGAGQISASQTQYSWDNKALFAQATFTPIPQLSLTAGIRYTWDKVRGSAESYRTLNPLTPSQRTVCFDTLRFTNPDGTRPKIIGSPTNKSQCHVDIEVSSKRPTWLIGVDYKPNEDVLIYAKYARGYRQGGINFTSVGLETWGPEKVDAYEVGAKLTFRGAVEGFFNIAGFYNNFREMQLFGGLTSSNTNIVAGGVAIINAGKARIAGIEVDSSINLFDSLRLDLGYTYLDTKLQDLVSPSLPTNSPYSAIVPQGNVGQPLTYSPKHRISLAATYTVPVRDSIGKMSVGATYIHTSSYIINASLSPIAGLGPAQDQLNLHANWNRVLGSPVDVGIFVTNALDRVYNVASAGGASVGYEAIQVSPPRMWGVRLRYNFQQ